jgi:hypothetical protein
MDKFSFFSHRKPKTPTVYIVTTKGETLSKGTIQSLFKNRQNGEAINFSFFESTLNLVKFSIVDNNVFFVEDEIKSYQVEYFLSLGKNEVFFDNGSFDTGHIKGIIIEGSVGNIHSLNLSQNTLEFLKIGDQLPSSGISVLGVIKGSGLKTLELPKATILHTGSTYTWRCSNVERLYAPKAVFNNNIPAVLSGVVFYAGIEYENVAEGVHSNLDYIRDKFSDVRYVANFINPNPPTNLSFSVNSATSITITFDLPVINTNDLDFYELFVVKKGEADEIAKLNIRDREITASGYVLDDLLEGFNYKVFLRTVDFYYNKSEKSQEIEFSTI